MTHSPSYPPASMGEREAAAYLGVSRTFLRGRDDAPKPRRWGGRILYVRAELDAFALSLPIDGESEEDDCEVDRIFRCG